MWVQVTAGRLPLTAGATLTWLGFSDRGTLAAYDSEVGAVLHPPSLPAWSHTAYLLPQLTLLPEDCCENITVQLHILAE